MRLLLATHNPGKRREWIALLEALDVELVSPVDLGLDIEVEEVGETYTENALLKARTLSNASALPTLADDSGLEVDALEGAPGVRSARFRLGTDEVRYRALLKAMASVPEEARGARFRCIAALIIPDGRAFTAEGVCEGRIGFAPRGAKGFGYDPVFYLPERGCTMAELSQEEKNRISHRARAARAMRLILERELEL
jgi:XTP/dITP diphosphohydrolase